MSHKICYKCFIWFLSLFSVGWCCVPIVSSCEGDELRVWANMKSFCLCFNIFPLFPFSWQFFSVSLSFSISRPQTNFLKPFFDASDGYISYIHSHFHWRMLFLNIPKIWISRLDFFFLVSATPQYHKKRCSLNRLCMTVWVCNLKQNGIWFGHTFCQKDDINLSVLRLIKRTKVGSVWPPNKMLVFWQPCGGQCVFYSSLS